MGCFSHKAQKAHPEEKEVVVPDVTQPHTDRLPAFGKIVSQGTLLTKSKLIRFMEGGIPKDYDVRETTTVRPHFIVKKCIHTPSGTVRSMKIIHKSALGPDSIGPDALLREASILRLLDHPGVVRLYEFFEDKFRYYLAEEMCAGSDLLTFLTNNPSSAAASVHTIMWQLLAVLDYVHSQGVIMRGLTFDCIQVVPGEHGQITIKCTDFSEASSIDSPFSDSIAKRASVCTAPEVFHGKCGAEADLWAAGVILHLLLFGKPPYANPENPDVTDYIGRGEVVLGNLSTLAEEQKELLYGLLDKSVKTRWTAQKALNSQWMSQRTNVLQSPQVVKETVAAMRNFHCSYKLKDAIFTFLSFQVISSAEASELSSVFLTLDRNGDGKVSREELLSYFRQNCREIDAIREVEDMLANIDSNNSGFIEYAEFLKSSVNAQKYASRQYLELAFKSFDIDGSGKISVNDLKAMVGGNQTEAEAFVKSVIDEADFNRDGEIDMMEFQTIAIRRF